MSMTRTSPSRGSGSAEITGFYDDDTGSIRYLATDPATRKAALIDIVLSFNPAGASTDTDGAEAILRQVEREKLDIEWILDTRPHAGQCKIRQS